MGNRREAYRWLQKAIDGGYRFYRQCRTEPLFENIRNDDQFEQMMAQMKRKVDDMRIIVMDMEKNASP